MGLLTRARALAAATAPASILAALLAPACYEPRLPDCTLACSSSSDCAPGQVCGAEGYCAAPEHACMPPSIGGPPADGPPPPADAPADAGAPPDAPPKVLLRVRASGGGAVVVEGAGSCDSDSQGGDCTYSVVAGLSIELRAVPHAGRSFDRWTSLACAAQDQTCVLTLVSAFTEARARFQNEHVTGLAPATE
jgi:hypothetical protein